MSVLTMWHSYERLSNSKPRFVTIPACTPQGIPRRNVAVVAEKFGRARKAGACGLAAFQPTVDKCTRRGG